MYRILLSVIRINKYQSNKIKRMFFNSDLSNTFDSYLKSQLPPTQIMSDQETTDTVEKLLDSDLNPTISNYSYILFYCRNLESTKRIMNLIKQHDFEPDYLFYHTYLLKICQYGSVEEIKSIYKEYTTEMELTIKTYNQLFYSLSIRNFHDLIDVFYNDLIEKDIYPDINTLNSLTHCFISNPKKIFTIFSEFSEKYHIYPNSGILKVMCTALLPQYLRTGLQWIESARKHGKTVQEKVYSMFLIRLGRKRNDTKEVYELLSKILDMMKEDKIKITSEISLSLLNISAIEGDSDFAKNLWSQMKSSEIEPNHDHYVGFIRACTNGSNFEECIKVLNEYQEKGHRLNIHLIHFLMQCCANCRLMKECINVFDQMKINHINPTIRTYTKILYTAFRCNRDEEALAMTRNIVSSHEWDVLLVRGMMLVLSSEKKYDPIFYILRESMGRQIRINSMCYLPLFFNVLRDKNEKLLFQFCNSLKYVNIIPSKYFVESVMSWFEQFKMSQYSKGVYEFLLSIKGLSTPKSEEILRRICKNNKRQVSFEVVEIPSPTKDQALCEIFSKDINFDEIFNNLRK